MTIKDKIASECRKIAVLNSINCTATGSSLMVDCRYILKLNDDLSYRINYFIQQSVQRTRIHIVNNTYTYILPEITWFFLHRKSFECETLFYFYVECRKRIWTHSKSRRNGLAEDIEGLSTRWHKEISVTGVDLYCNLTLFIWTLIFPEVYSREKIELDSGGTGNKAEDTATSGI